MQIKTTMINYMFTRTTEVKRWFSVWTRTRSQWDSHTLGVEFLKWSNHFSKLSSIYLSEGPSSWHWPRTNDDVCPQKCLYQKMHSSIIIATKRKQPKCPLTRDESTKRSVLVPWMTTGQYKGSNYWHLHSGEEPRGWPTDEAKTEANEYWEYDPIYVKFKTQWW